MTNLLRRFVAPLLVGTMVLAVAACGGDPLEPEEHPEAAGVVILDEATGAELARSVGSRAAFNNSITVPLNGTREVEIRYIDENNPSNIFAPDEDEGESTRVTIASPAVVSYSDHGDHGDFRGLTAGTTTATIDLIHGGHEDFTSGPLTIVVQ